MKKKEKISPATFVWK